MPTTDRAASLIVLYDDQCDVDQLTVGQCDALLYDLRRRLFGDLLDAVVRCPNCDEEVSLPLSLAELQPDLVGRPAELSVTAEGFRVSCRAPRNHDLRALARLDEAVTERDILTRCLIEATDPNGHPAPADDLPDTLVTAAVSAMEDADPGANVLLSISCPCGAQWTDLLDIRSVLWSDLQQWTTHLLHDVHQLATSYGWSERDILELSPWRRAWYQQASGW